VELVVQFATDIGQNRISSPIGVDLQQVGVRLSFRVPSNSEQLRGQPLQLTGPMTCQGEKVRFIGVCAYMLGKKTAAAHNNVTQTCMMTSVRSPCM
jgi:hypothetical protein